MTDGVVVAVQADGALLVSQQGRTSRSQVAQAARALNSVSVRLLGCVLNMAKVAKAEAYQYEAYRVVAAATPEVPADATPSARHAERVDGVVSDRTQELTRLSR